MLSEPAQLFLSRCVNSAEMLDVLMVLVREPEGDWTATTVSARIFSVPQSVERRLTELVQLGLVAERSDHPGAYRAQIGDGATRDAVEDVRQAYDANRAQVIGVVLSGKRDPLASFSDAFRLRSDT